MLTFTSRPIKRSFIGGLIKLLKLDMAKLSLQDQERRNAARGGRSIGGALAHVSNNQKSPSKLP